MGIFSMKNFVVTFVKPNGLSKTIEIMGRDVDDVRAKTLNSNGEISYFKSICINDNEEE